MPHIVAEFNPPAVGHTIDYLETKVGLQLYRRISLCRHLITPWPCDQENLDLLSQIMAQYRFTRYGK